MPTNNDHTQSSNLHTTMYPIQNEEILTIAAVTLLIYEYVKLKKQTDTESQVELSEMNYSYNETILTQTSSGEQYGEINNEFVNTIDGNDGNDTNTSQEKLIAHHDKHIDIIETVPTMAIQSDNPIPTTRRWMCGLFSRNRRYMTAINHAINTLQETSEGRVVFFLNNKKTDLQVGITINDKEKRIIVVFRGSKSFMNYKYNFSICKKKLDGDVAVHSGFYHQLYDGGSIDFINDKVMRLLSNYPSYTVYCTGHSMGGSVASLYGYLLTKHKSISTNVIVVSFGAPRLGNGAFRDEFESTRNLFHIRVVNNYDIVTKMPWINFYHTGMNISTIAIQTAYTSNDNDDVLRKNNKYRYVFLNHSMSSYYASVTND